MERPTPNTDHLDGAPRTQPVATAAKVFGTLIGIVPLGIGLTVLIFLWATPSDEFGAPPLVFRIFGSFIALGFIGIGGLMAFSGIFAGKVIATAKPAIDVTKIVDAPPVGTGKYVCPHCAATLQKAEVSPLGDVKCPFCGSWFNIHGKA